MTQLIRVKDFEEYAESVLSKNAWGYYKSGAGYEQTLSLNRTSFSKLRIRPRMLRDVSNRNMTLTVFGDTISMPIGVAPTAMQRMANEEGECANAKAAEKMGTIFILSTIATSSIEEVFKAAPNCIKWFQLYIYKDRNITLGLVKRAEKHGFKAIVLTVDTPIAGIRYADMKNQFVLPSHLRMANFTDDKADKINEKSEGSGFANYVSNLFESSINWKDVLWLQNVTNLPIILKGILTAEDAIMGADIGVAGILVSNHGARQLDGVPATIEALPEIVRAVGNRCEVFLDGGVMQGTDVFKALALGAKMVFLGRPALWGLTHSGEEGVAKVLSILKNEFDLSLALAGCKNINDIKKEMVVHESYYAKL